MLATEHIDTARKFLQDADREYEAGDILQASEKLWGAASHVVIAEMKSRGNNAQTHRAMVDAVQQFAVEFDDASLIQGFRAARYFHSNFYNGFMNDYEFEVDRPEIHRFVERMIELTSAPNN